MDKRSACGETDVMHEPDDTGNAPKPPVWIYMVLIGAWLACVCLCFALLRHFTARPLWVCVLLALPLGVGLFYACIQMAEHS